MAHLGQTPRARQQVSNHVSAGRPNGGAATDNAVQQVASHNVAGQAGSENVLGFENAEQIVTGSAVARAVPDVHLTRFAAYFVALNAEVEVSCPREARATLPRHAGILLTWRTFRSDPQRSPQPVVHRCDGLSDPSSTFRGTCMLAFRA